MKKHSFIIFLVSWYILTQICVEFGKEFANVGAAKLKDYNWADWLVLSVETAGSVGLTVMAFFSRAFANHIAQLDKGNGNGNGHPEATPPLPAGAKTGDGGVVAGGKVG